MSAAALTVVFALLIILTAPERESMSVLANIPTIAKSITGAATAFGAAFAVSYLDQTIVTAEWVTIAVATLTAGLAVWAVPNKQPVE